MRARLCGLAALVVGAVVTVTGTAPAAAQSSYVERRIWDSRVTESSGLARSTYARSILWTHNDRGDSARILGIRSDGTTRAVLSLSGAGAVDWEDIAAGPNNSLWIGDIGDNGRSRKYITVYRVTEPRYLSSTSVSYKRYDLRYPDGAHDAEGLMVHPRTGRLYVVSKASSGAAIYRAPQYLSTSSANKLTKVARAPATVTGATFTPGGGRFVLCNYTRAYVYKSFGGTPTVISKPNADKQGESIEVNRGGTALLIGQEGYDSPVYSTPLPSW